MRQYQHYAGVYRGQRDHQIGAGQRIAAALLRPWFGRGVLLVHSKVVNVRVFAPPDASCDHRMTWSKASAFLGERLKCRFGNRVTTEHIEIFSPRSFEFPEVLAAIEAGGQLPVVAVSDRIVSQGGKISERITARAVEAVLTNGDGRSRRDHQ